jgi:hypothetical protein
MTTTRIVLAAARRISAHFLAEPTGPEFIKTLSAACSRRGNRRLGYGSSTFREFPELASEQHKQVLLFWIWDAELAANLACEEVGAISICLGTVVTRRGSTRLTYLLCFDPS